MKNLQDWRTTMLGATCFLSGILYTFYNDKPDYIILSILLGGGVMLIFSPDSLLTSLRRFGRNISKDEKAK